MSAISETPKLLKDLSFEEVINEAARRLCIEFEEQYGRKFFFGYFRFVFNEGRFIGVENRLRHRSYWCQGKRGNK